MIKVGDMVKHIRHPVYYQVLELVSFQDVKFRIKHIRSKYIDSDCNEVSYKGYIREDLVEEIPEEDQEAARLIFDLQCEECEQNA